MSILEVKIHIKITEIKLFLLLRERFIINIYKKIIIYNNSSQSYTSLHSGLPYICKIINRTPK